MYGGEIRLMTFFPYVFLMFTNTVVKMEVTGILSPFFKDTSPKYP